MGTTRAEYHAGRSYESPPLTQAIPPPVSHRTRKTRVRHHGTSAGASLVASQSPGLSPGRPEPCRANGAPSAAVRRSRKMLRYPGMPAAGHSVVERRSLRYHAVIAARLATEDTILARARARVEQWIREGTVAVYYAEGWQQLLEQPPHEISAFLNSDSERARAFRQVSPFAGVLDPRERWRLWAATTGDDTTAA